MKLRIKLNKTTKENKTNLNTFKSLLMKKQKNGKDEEQRMNGDLINSIKNKSIKTLSKISRNINIKIKNLSNNYCEQRIKIVKQKTKSNSANNTKDNLNNNNNQNKNISRNYLNKGLNAINTYSTDINSGVNTKNFSSSKKKKHKIYFPIKRNAINFMDRNKLKLTKTINLKLFEQFEEELNKIDKEKINIHINNNHFLDSDNFLIYNSLKTLPEIKKEKILKKIRKSKKEKDNVNQDNFQKIKKEIHKIYKNQKMFKTRYSLKKLMEINPYHSVPKYVKYSNLIEIRNISEQLSYVSGIPKARDSKSQRHFFRSDINFNYNKILSPNLKVIDSVTVIYKNDLTSRKGELVWRILDKLQKKTVSSSFRQACVFQGYSELWKYHSIALEKMLVNYSSYKWFITKDKFMEKDVFTEFLQYMDINKKENILFPEKVYALFDYNGTNKINIKIFYFIMELISTSSKNIEKLNFIIELCEDSKNENYINVIEMQEILKSMILHENYQKDYNHLHESIKKEFQVEKIEPDLYITKSQLFNFLINNELFKKFITLFKNQLKNAYYYYNEEILSSFNSTIRNAKKFLNEQNEVNRLCKKEVSNFEKILKSIQNKKTTVEKNKMIIEAFENNT